ncbi:MAG: tRNA pseudouridine(55) synthase TruB [Snowella sp.]|jgi:tRNA pseudouridine55 synthase|nr:MAG: tRNA pseudouridine(55) synthase TruB [Snowella sp.]
MLGFLNLNKPKNWTSHDCVAKVRRLLKIRKVGHGGTLDPLATGVLPIAVGKATRLISYLPHRKAYQAKVRFGIQTATDDLEGEILKTCSASELTLDKITPYLPQFLGIIEQIPPQYSAIQRDGQRLYDLARQGKMVEVPSRRVEIFDMQVLRWQEGEFPELDLSIRCGEGTYIRAIARDLGELLGVGATLARLIRTESGGMELANSITLEELADRVESQDFGLTSPQTVLTDLPKILLDAETAQRWCQGQKIAVTEREFVLNLPFRVLQEDGTLLGIGEIAEVETINRLIPKVVLEPFVTR